MEENEPNDSKGFNPVPGLIIFGIPIFALFCANSDGINRFLKSWKNISSAKNIQNLEKPREALVSKHWHEISLKNFLMNFNTTLLLQRING